jgi:hypothetical protein
VNVVWQEQFGGENWRVDLSKSGTKERSAAFSFLTQSHPLIAKLSLS